MKSYTIIHGYIGRKPELKTFTKDGQEREYVTFSVGVSRDYGDETDWYDVTMFGSRAKVIHKFFHKGSQIICSGRMQSSTYEEGGKKRKSWKLIVDDFDFCDSNGNSGSSVSDSDIPDSWAAADEDNPFE